MAKKTKPEETQKPVEEKDEKAEIFSKLNFNLSDERKKEIGQDIAKKIRVAEEEISGVKTKVAEYNRWYEEEEVDDNPDFPFKGHSKVNIPIMASIIDAVAARLTEFVMPADDFYDIDPGGEEFIEAVPKRRDFYRNVFTKIGLRKRVEDAIHDATRTPFGLVKLYWERREEEKIVATPRSWLDNVLGLVVPRFRVETKLEKVEVYNDVVVENIIFDHLVWSSRSKGTQDLPFLAHIIPLDENSFNERKARMGYEITEEGDVKPTQDGTPSKSEVQIEKAEGTAHPKGKEYRIAEWWGKYDLQKNGKFINACITIDLNSDTFLKAKRNPNYSGEIPIYFIRLDRRTARLIGKCVSQMILPLHKSVNAMIRAAIDNSTLANTLSGKKRKGSSVNTSRQPFYPGVLLEVDRMDDIETFVFPDIKPSAFRLIEILMMMIERRTPITSYALGSSSQIDPYAPAKKAQMLMEEANKLLARWITNISDDVKNILRGVDNLYQQYLPLYYPDGYKYKTKGDEGKPLFPVMTPEEIIGDYDFVMSAVNQAISEETEKSSALGIFERFKGDPYINQEWLHKLVLQAFRRKDINIALVKQPTLPTIATGQGAGQLTAPPVVSPPPPPPQGV